MTEYKLLTFDATYQRVVLLTQLHNLRVSGYADFKVFEHALGHFKHYYFEKYDTDELKSVSNPNILTISIGPNSTIVDVLYTIFRKLVEEYNFALKQKYQDKVA